MMNEFVKCCVCGKRVSNAVAPADGPLVTRAWVECPECMEETETQWQAYGWVIETLTNEGEVAYREFTRDLDYVERLQAVYAERPSIAHHLNVVDVYSKSRDQK